MSAYADFQHGGRNGGHREREKEREGGPDPGPDLTSRELQEWERDLWCKAHLPLVTSARWRWLLCVCPQVDSSRFYPASPLRISLRFSTWPCGTKTKHKFKYIKLGSKYANFSISVSNHLGFTSYRCWVWNVNAFMGQMCFFLSN